jgi:hypothetical protein
MFGPTALDAFVGGSDPAERIEAAHRTAAALIEHGRSVRCSAETARLVALADEVGIEDVAELWANLPPQTLPGVLWRLYALRAGIRGDAAAVARGFDTGRRLAPVDEVVAGVEDPPGPREVEALADAVLTGAFSGDLAVALERAAAFCRVVATGWAADCDSDSNPDRAAARTRRAADLARTGHQLASAASDWRKGRLH